MNSEIDYVKLLGERLETALVLRKKTKAELSVLTDIPTSTLSNISAGKSEASFSKVAKIAKALELSLDYFSAPTDEEREVHAKSEIKTCSKVKSIANCIRLLDADDKQTLFEFFLPTLIRELEDETKKKFRMIDWRDESINS